MLEIIAKRQASKPFISLEKDGYDGNNNECEKQNDSDGVRVVCERQRHVHPVNPYYHIRQRNDNRERGQNADNVIKPLGRNCGIGVAGIFHRTNKRATEIDKLARGEREIFEAVVIFFPYVDGLAGREPGEHIALRHERVEKHADGALVSRKLEDVLLGHINDVMPSAIDGALRVDDARGIAGRYF